MLKGIRRKEEEKTSYVSFRLENRIIKLLEEVAKEENTTRSELYRYAVKELLKKLGKIEDN